jgi:hypothetical protein
VTKIKGVLIVTMAVVLTGGAEAQAQGGRRPGERGYLNVNFGAQPQERLITTTESFQLYDETATWTTSQPIETGPVFEIGGAYRLRRNLAVGASVSVLSGKKTSSTVDAMIPDPIFYDSFKSVTKTTSGLSHSERGVHLQAMWSFPVAAKFDVAVSGGPSFISVEQQLLTAINVPAGTQELNVASGTESGMAVGFNAGVDASYMITPRYGVGLSVGYNGGAVDLPSVAELKVGGVRTGFGLRVRF